MQKSDRMRPEERAGESKVKLRVEDISCSLDRKLIIDGIRTEIESGSFVGLVGPNGCGKSTLLKNIYQVLKADQGVIYLDGQRIDRMSNRQRARHMAVMQQENQISFDLTVYEMVLLGRFSHQKALAGSSERDRKVVMDCLAEVGLTGYEKRHFLSLSGGEKQRALVARALAQEASFIILDEPINHLDIGYQYQIMKILKRQKLTVLSSIHDLNIAGTYCDRILLMKEGRLLAAGSPEEILVPERIRDLFGIGCKIIKNEQTGRNNILYLPDL